MALRSGEHQRCNEAARRTRRPLIVGYVNALHYWGVEASGCTLSSELIHVSSPHRTSRPRLRGVKPHMWPSSQDVRRMSGCQFLLASPAMAWAQISHYIDDESLAIVGSALLCRDKVLKAATKSELVGYVTANPRFTGRARCMRVIPYLVENTDSPPEIQVHMLLYGIANITTNHPVQTRDRRWRFIDIAIPDVKVGIEYQGAYHSDPAQMRSDATRMNELIAMGWIIIQATAADLRTEETRNRFVKSIVEIVNRRRHALLAGMQL